MKVELDWWLALWWPWPWGELDTGESARPGGVGPWGWSAKVAQWRRAGVLGLLVGAVGKLFNRMPQINGWRQKMSLDVDGWALCAGERFSQTI